MSRARTAIILASLATCGVAHAETSAPTVTQLRLAARSEAVDTFAWREGEQIWVERRALEDLSIVIPETVLGERVALSSIPGMHYNEDEAASAININCSSECFATQRMSLARFGGRPAQTSAVGAYVNYDIDAQWLPGGAALGAVAQGVVFGPFGLVENSWVANTGGDIHDARLETRWTMDDQRHEMRFRLGDSIAADVSGAPFRFGGIQFGRAFSLAPSMITYPTPALAGDASSSSTIELYVNGALQAREQVDAGPFAIDNAPLLAGAGSAEMVVTDVLGRQQIVSRPFFISTNLLRPGLSDWSVSAGALRRDYGAANWSYGQGFVSGDYRLGITNHLTLDAGLESSSGDTAMRIGAVVAAPWFGQVILSHAESNGGANAFSYYYDSDIWSFGIDVEHRDQNYHALSDAEFDGDRLLSSAAINFGVDLRSFGGLSLTAARIRVEDQPNATTFGLSYTPAIADGAISVRALYTEREEQDLAVAVSLSVPLGGNVSGSLDSEHDSHGGYVGASAQSAPPPQGGFGWRARVVAGAQTRIQLASLLRGRFGDSAIEFASIGKRAGLRANQTGSLGWIEGDAFVAPVINGGFAIVDAGAADVDISRDQLPIGRTGRDGRAVVVNLRPYDDNVISIDADDLPLDRAPSVTQEHVTPANGAGIVARMTAPAQVANARATMQNGDAAPRGAVLVRDRDGARFPVGSNGRVVILGALPSDSVRLDTAPNCHGAAAPDTTTIVLSCAVAS